MSAKFTENMQQIVERVLQVAVVAAVRQGADIGGFALQVGALIFGLGAVAGRDGGVLPSPVVAAAVR